VPLHNILQPLREALRLRCGRRDLSINEIDRPSTRTVLYALTGIGSVAARTDRKCILNQLFPKRTPTLWMGILLELRKRAEQDRYELAHVSIQAFEGTTSETVEPLLRAEWDLAVSRSRNGPAQPHWHAYSVGTRVEPDRLTAGDFNRFGGATRQSGGTQNRQHKVHFALCANWHKGGSHYEALSTPGQLKDWILGAVEYIQSQI
jgi:hypothetical protein